MPRVLDLPIWLFDVICNPIVKAWTKTTRIGSRCGNRLRHVHQTHPWIWFTVKTVIIIIGLLGTAIGFYFGWRSIDSARTGNLLSEQGVLLSAKQLCSSGDLAEADRLWCDDPKKNLPLSTIMGSASSAVRAVKRTVDHGVNTVSSATALQYAASTATSLKREIKAIMSSLRPTIAAFTPSPWSGFKRWVNTNLNSPELFERDVDVGCFLFCLLLMQPLTQSQFPQPGLDLCLVSMVLVFGALGIYHSSASLIFTCCFVAALLNGVIVDEPSTIKKLVFGAALIFTPAVGALLSNGKLSDIDIPMVTKGLAFMSGTYFSVIGFLQTKQRVVDL